MKRAATGLVFDPIDHAQSELGDDDNFETIGKSLRKHHKMHVNSSLSPGDSQELMYPTSLSYKMVDPLDLMMSQIDEEEETKIDINKLEGYTYIKNEQLPQKSFAKFEAHQNEGICITYSKCGTVLVTAGGN